MFRTLSPTSSSIILQLIDIADEYEVCESGSNGTNLSNPFASTWSTEARYLTFEVVKKGGGNTKKGVKAAGDFDYLTPVAKKIFNQLWHVFT